MRSIVRKNWWLLFSLFSLVVSGWQGYVFLTVSESRLQVVSGIAATFSLLATCIGALNWWSFQRGVKRR